MEGKRKFNPFIPISVFLLVLVIGLAIFCVKLLNAVEDYKAAYDELIEAEKEAEQSAETYQSLYNDLVYAMLDDAVAAENIGNLTVSVWHNAIWNTSDSETDKFTKVNGKFVDDFNDALSNLFRDKDFRADIDDLYSRQNAIKTSMKKMLNPPIGFENAYKALENMYNAYIRFTDVVLKCDGSLESFSDDFGEADDELIQKYRAAELYIK